MKVLVYIEAKNGEALNSSLETLGAAVKIGEAEAITTDAGAAMTAAEYGVPVTVIKAEAHQDLLVAVLESYIMQKEPEVVLLGATELGKDVAPRLAQRLGAGCITDVIEVKNDENGITFVRAGFGGNIYEEMSVCGGVLQIATIRGGSFEKPDTNKKASVTEQDASAAEGTVRVKLLESVREISEAVDLENAEVIVAGGRGMGDEEGFQLVEELASALGGEVAVSRPAMEAGWASRAHQVGQSGKTVAPKLYIACGISGAMQHVSAIMKSNYIIAINKDADAPVFEIADLGIVGDVKAVLPLLIEEFKKHRS